MIYQLEFDLGILPIPQPKQGINKSLGEAKDQTTW